MASEGRPLGLSDACMLQVVECGLVFSYAPCFANLAPAAVSAFATGVSVAPALAVITPEGVSSHPLARYNTGDAAGYKKDLRMALAI